MLKIFLHSYRIRLKEFRKTYNILAVSIILMLGINVILTFVNKPLYLILPNPNKHFVYEYHFIKELSHLLKDKNVNRIMSDNKELLLRLKFYKITQGNDYFISTKEFFNFDERLSIDYHGRELYIVYLKKLK